MREYYIRGSKSKAATDKMSSELYGKRMRMEAELPGEMTEWIEWFAPLQENDEPVRENTKVEAMLKEQELGVYEDLLRERWETIKGHQLHFKYDYKVQKLPYQVD